MDFRKYLEMFPTGVRLQHFRSWCARSSSNSYNFFVSTPNRAPFEAMDSWLPKIWNNIWYAWNELQEVIKMCPTVAKMGVRLRHVRSWCGRWRILRCGDFATISQLRMSAWGCEMALVCQRVVLQLRNTLPNGVSVAKWKISRPGGFVAISQLWNGCTGLRNGTRVPRALLTAAKIFAEEDGWLRNHFTAGSHFRSGSLLLWNFAASTLSLFFELLLIPNFLLSPFFDIPPDFDHPKTYVKSKQSKIKALKSKLKQVMK